MFQSRQLERVERKTKFRGQREEEIQKRRGRKELQKRRNEESDNKRWYDAPWEDHDE